MISFDASLHYHNDVLMISIEAEKHGKGGVKPYSRGPVDLALVLEEVCALIGAATDKTLKPLIMKDKVSVFNGLSLFLVWLTPL
jgi:hypothetical protein